MSDIYTSQKEYLQSDEILLKVLKKVEAVNNKRQEAKVLTSLGRNLMELNEIDKAIGYLSKSLEITVELNAPYEKLENYRNLAHANAILHNFNAADSLQDLFAETYGRLFKIDSTADLIKEKATGDVIVTPSSSKTSEWLIALLLLTVVGMLSVFAFQEKKMGD